MWLKVIFDFFYNNFRFVVQEFFINLFSCDIFRFILIYVITISSLLNRRVLFIWIRFFNFFRMLLLLLWFFLRFGTLLFLFDLFLLIFVFFIFGLCFLSDHFFCFFWLLWILVIAFVIILLFVLLLVFIIWPIEFPQERNSFFFLDFPQIIIITHYYYDCQQNDGHQSHQKWAYFHYKKI